MLLSFWQHCEQNFKFSLITPKAIPQQNIYFQLLNKRKLLQRIRLYCIRKTGVDSQAIEYLDFAPKNTVDFIVNIQLAHCQ